MFTMVIFFFSKWNMCDKINMKYTGNQNVKSILMVCVEKKNK